MTCLLYKKNWGGNPVTEAGLGKSGRLKCVFTGRENYENVILRLVDTRRKKRFYFKMSKLD